MSYVTYESPEPNGLASLLGGLIEQNLQREPGRLRLLKPANVAIEALDAGVGATIRISAGSVVVSDEASRDAHLTVTADPNRLLAITAAPLRLGFPDPFSAEGRAALADIVSGRIRVRGLVRHPIRLRRLTMLLSVA